MKRKALVPLALGLMIGVFAVKMAVNTFKKAQAGNKTTTMTVVRAIQDISPLEEVTREMVELVEAPISPLLPSAERITSLEDVVGRVSAKPIPEHAPVLVSMLAPEGTPVGMVGRIPPGYRAFSVRIDEVTGVAYQVRPGDWVDVLVVLDVPSAGGRRETVAEVVLQRVQVAAIGNATTTMGNAGRSKVRPAKSATLLIKEQDAPKLHLAQTQGRITLAMRGDDKTIMKTPASASLDELRGGARPKVKTGGEGWMKMLMSFQSQKPAPQAPAVMPAAPKPPHAVLVYHGLGSSKQLAVVERITFENAQSSRILSVAFGPPTQGLSGTSASDIGSRSKKRSKSKRKKM